MENTSLCFPKDSYTEGITEYGGKQIPYRFYKNVPYVSRPNAPELQVLNVYEPTDIDATKAPIFFYQRTGGMGEAHAVTIEEEEQGRGEHRSTRCFAYALSQGYVIVSPGARGRDTVVDGKYVGRGALPMSIVDLKAAVRYIRHNRGIIPGDPEKIVETGLSSGGGMSALLGASGNSEHFRPYLEEIGAADERDDIFVCSVSSPITDFSHIDAAYEWLFSVDNVDGLHAGNEAFNGMSRDLAKSFEEYVDSLKLCNPADGTPVGFAGGDTYTPFLLHGLEAAATKYLSALTESEREAWLAEEHNQAVVIWDGTQAKIPDLHVYCMWNTGRWMRYVGCYDGFDTKPSRENEAFANSDGTGAGHFSRSLGEIVSRYPGYEEIGRAWIEDAAKHAGAEYLINPMNYLGTDEQCTIAPHWYLRCGCHHETTGNVFLNLALRLAGLGVDLDWRFSWMQRHSSIAEIEKEEAFAFYNRCMKL